MTGETFKATMIGVMQNGTAVVFDFGYADVISSAHIDMGTAAGDFQTLVQAKMLAVLPSTYSVVRYRFACVGGSHVGEVGYVVAGTGHVGLRSADTLPQEVAISLKRSTGHASRRDRGRIFLGPVDISFYDSLRADEVQIDTPLTVARDLLKSTVTAMGISLIPAIIASNGTYSGNRVTQVDIGQIFVQRKSRRLRFNV